MRQGGFACRHPVDGATFVILRLWNDGNAAAVTLPESWTPFLVVRRDIRGPCFRKRLGEDLAHVTIEWLMPQTITALMLLLVAAGCTSELSEDFSGTARNSKDRGQTSSNDHAAVARDAGGNSSADGVGIVLIDGVTSVDEVVDAGASPDQSGETDLDSAGADQQSGTADSDPQEAGASDTPVAADADYSSVRSSTGSNVRRTGRE